MSRQLILAGYLVIAAGAATLELTARLTGRVATLGRTVAAFNSTRFGRPLLLAAWLWAGWHFFVRANWG